MMANETIKLITGIGESLINQVFTYNALNNQVYILNLSARKETRSLIPKDERAFLQTDYVWLCSSPVNQAEIDSDAFNQMIANGNVDVIDVRELHEIPIINEFDHIKIPLSQLSDNSSLIKSKNVITLCQSGKRSLQATKILNGIFGDTKKIYSLHGGILQWKQDRAKQVS
jgi:adenylyltransferase/sulfurtransferase